MKNKLREIFGKDGIFALVVLMFFSLALLSPSIYNTFDKTKETLASAGGEEIYLNGSLERYEPNPSSAYVVEDFFRKVNYYDYEGASKYLFNKDDSEKFLSIFEGLYYIEPTIIESGALKDDVLSHNVTVNTIPKPNESNKIFKGTTNITVTTKQDESDRWYIYGIKY